MYMLILLIYLYSATLIYVYDATLIYVYVATLIHVYAATLIYVYVATLIYVYAATLTYIYAATLIYVYAATFRTPNIYMHKPIALLSSQHSSNANFSSAKLMKKLQICITAVRSAVTIVTRKSNFYQSIK